MLIVASKNFIHSIDYDKTDQDYYKDQYFKNFQLSLFVKLFGNHNSDFKTQMYVSKKSV